MQQLSRGKFKINPENRLTGSWFVLHEIKLSDRSATKTKTSNTMALSYSGIVPDLQDKMSKLQEALTIAKKEAILRDKEIERLGAALSRGVDSWLSNQVFVGRVIDSATCGNGLEKRIEVLFEVKKSKGEDKDGGKWNSSTVALGDLNA